MLQSTVIAEVSSSRVDHFALDLVTIGEVQVAKVKRWSWRKAVWLKNLTKTKKKEGSMTEDYGQT